MKKMWMFLFLCFFAIGVAFAAGLNVKVNPKQAAINSNITIDFSIEQDDSSTFAYQVGIKKPTGDLIGILNNTVTGFSDNGSFQYNITNLQAGDYEAFIFLYPATYVPSKFTILPYMDFDVSPQKLELFVYEDTSVQSVDITNLGNVPVFISATPSGFKSDASVLPITSDLNVSSNKSFVVSVKKPDEHYNATLALTGTYANFNKTTEVPIEVYNPIVKIELINVTLSKTENETVISGKIENSGNVYRSIKVVFSAASGERTENMVVQANQTADFNYTFAKTDTIKSMKIQFINSNGKEDTVSHSFAMFGLPFEIPKLPLLSGQNWIFLIISLLLIIAISYLIFRKRPKPEVSA